MLPYGCGSSRGRCALMPTAISYREIQLALRTVLLTVSTLPANRVWENQGPYDPPKHPGQSYVLEQFVPGPSQLYTASANGANGIKDVRGLYIVQWFAQSGDGTPNVGGITELRDGPDAILTAFPPGKGFPMTSGLCSASAAIRRRSRRRSRRSTPASRTSP
jgi:hypothetical protein